MRLSSQLKNPKRITRLLCFYLQLSLAIDSIRNILIHSNPAAGESRVLARVFLRLWVKLLNLAVELFVRRQGPIKLLWLNTEGRVKWLDALRNMLFLRTCTALLPL